MHAEIHPDRGRPEPDRTRVKAVVAVAAGIIVMVLLLGWASVRFTRSFGMAKEGTEPVPMSRPPYGERVSAHWESPQGDLAEVRAQAARRLDGYRWLDRTAGVVQIPIERAMELLAAGTPPVAATPPPENHP